MTTKSVSIVIRFPCSLCGTRKIDFNSEELEYHVSRSIVEPNVQSNEYMVLQGFQMHQVTGCKNPVPKHQSKSMYQTTFEQWHDNDFGVCWKMDGETRRKALARCGNWDGCFFSYCNVKFVQHVNM